MIFFLILSFVLFLPFSQSQTCFDFKSTTCNLCSFNSYKNSTFNWNFTSFSSSLCLEKSPFPNLQPEIHINSSSNNTIYDGSLANPCPDLFSAFQLLMINQSSYFNTSMNFYLSGTNPHYLYTSQPASNQFFLFRRYYLNFTIQPLLCKLKNVTGCFEDDSKIIEIFVKRTDILFFVSYQARFLNLNFNGIDIPAYYNIQDPLIKQQYLQTPLCSESSLIINTSQSNPLQSLCFLMNLPIFFSNQAIYGFINLEMLYDCLNCSFPSLQIENCQFSYFNIINATSTALNSLINILPGFPVIISMKNSTITTFYLYKGVINVEQPKDPFYKYITPLTSLYTLKILTNWTINIMGSLISGLNTFQNVLNSNSGLDFLSVFNLKLNQTLAVYTVIPFVNFTIDNSTIFNISNQNAISLLNLYLVIVSGFNPFSGIYLTNSTFYYNSYIFLLYSYNNFLEIIISESKFLNNMESTFFFYSNCSTFINNLVDFLYMGMFSFLQVLETNINITSSTISNIYSIDSDNPTPFIDNKAKYGKLLGYILQTTPYSSGVILLQNLTFFYLNTTLICTTDIIYQMGIFDCSFSSINLGSNCFVSLDIDYKLEVFRNSFFNVSGDVLFNFTISRKRFFANITLENSQISFLKSFLNEYVDNSCIIMTGLNVQNVRTVNIPTFIDFSNYNSLRKIGNLSLTNSIFNNLNGIYSNAKFLALYQVSWWLLCNITFIDPSPFIYIFVNGPLYVANLTSIFCVSCNIYIYQYSMLYIGNSVFDASTLQFEGVSVSGNVAVVENTIMKNFECDQCSGGKAALNAEIYSIRDLLLFNCTFINNIMDFNLVVFTPETLTGLYENLLLNYSIVCYLYNIQGAEMIYKTYSFPGCGDVLYSGSYMALIQEGLMIINATDFNLKTNGSFSLINCEFEMTISSVIYIAMDIVLDATIILQNCFISDIVSEDAFLQGSNIQLYIINSRFENISYSASGKLIDVSFSDLFIKNTPFISLSSDDETGGIIYLLSSSIILNNSYCDTITTRIGGLLLTSDSIVEIYYITINNAMTKTKGAGFYFQNSQLTLENCEISNSIAKGDGLIYLYYLNESIIVNISLINGIAGVYLEGSEDNMYYNFTNFSCIGNNGKTGTCFTSKQSNIFMNFAYFINVSSSSSIIYCFSSFDVYTITLQNVDFSINSGVLFLIVLNNVQFNIEFVTFENNEFQTSLISLTDSDFISFNSVFIAETTDFTAQSSSRSFISGTTSTVELNNQSFYGNYYTGGIALKTSSLNMTSTVFFQCFGAIELEKNSQLQSFYSKFIDGLNSASGGISSTDSSIFLLGTLFINNSGLSASGSDISAINSLSTAIEILIQDSVFSTINQLSVYFEQNFTIILINNSFSSVSSTSQALYLLNINTFQLESSSFQGFSYYSALEFSNTNSYSMAVSINSSNFSKCSSFSDGGALLLTGFIEFSLFNSIFSQNFANLDGGAIAFQCDSCTSTSFIANCSLQANKFLQNKALNNGGALKMFRLNTAAILLENIFQGNTASVGNDISTDPQSIKLSSLDSLDMILAQGSFDSQGIVEGVSGNYVEFYALLFDEMGNFLMTESQGQIKALQNNGNNTSDLKILYNTELITNGTSSFNLFLFGTPNSTYEMILVSSQNNEVNQTFLLYLRLCIRGEHLINSQCLECDFGFFSLSPENDCASCPANAYCMGRDLLLPQEGYWRFNENSSLMIKCQNLLSCPDQRGFYQLNTGNTSNLISYNFSKEYQFQCGQGSYGNLCVNCMMNYGVSSDKSCVECGVKPDIIILAFLNFALLVYQCLSAFDNDLQDVQITRSLMKLLVNHNNYLNSLDALQSLVFSNDINFLLSFSMRFSAVGTITDGTIYDCFLQRFFGPDKVVIMRITFFSFSPLLITFLLVIFFYICLMIPKIKNKMGEKNRLTILIFCFILVVYNFYSKLVINAFTLLKCISLDDTSSRTFLEIDPNIECYAADHKFYLLIVFIPNLLIWCLGWPFFYGVILTFKKRKTERFFSQTRSIESFTIGPLELGVKGSHLMSPMKKNIESLKHIKDDDVNKSLQLVLTDEQTQSIFQRHKILRFIMIEYHSSAYAWDEFFFCFNLILTSLTLLSNSLEPTFFVSLVMAIFFIMLVISSKVLPFRYAEVNFVSRISYIALLLTYYCVANVIFVGDNEIQQKFYLTLIYLINAMFYSFWIYVFLLGTIIKFKNIIYGFFFKTKIMPMKKGSKTTTSEIQLSKLEKKGKRPTQRKNHVKLNFESELPKKMLNSP